ncbi:Uncharacterized protein HZ326_5406 [Fusarium oxysporum f. sp. albedinis]|nr:Uncharacterized protein HZ326_5406 [Fusarium oxysporum f. sp. albedinis]
MNSSCNIYHTVGHWFLKPADNSEPTSPEDQPLKRLGTPGHFQAKSTKIHQVRQLVAADMQFGDGTPPTNGT